MDSKSRYTNLPVLYKYKQDPKGFRLRINGVLQTHTHTWYRALITASHYRIRFNA
ncbi:hypothetical protein BJV82DRAFT_614424 [Fennellomyces sp. T-0311]|nr:hypothetical protein BJV82DRAFT_614424 [Fennellomyces sp. T-0311]